MISTLCREYELWRRYPKERLHWLIRYRNCPLSNKEFEFKSRRYRYFVHPYNRTWANERAVEIPIIHDFLSNYKDEDVLEIGNVLSHYFSKKHTVVDKYEKCCSRSVINEDITTFSPQKKYKCIVSISTIEHVGWDEGPKKPEKVFEAFVKIKDLLAPGGKAIVTIPIGYNTFLDDCIGKMQIDASEIFYLKRVSQENEWKPVDMNSALQCRFDSPFPNANAMAFMIFDRQL